MQPCILAGNYPSLKCKWTSKIENKIASLLGIGHTWNKSHQLITEMHNAAKSRTSHDHIFYFSNNFRVHRIQLLRVRSCAKMQKSQEEQVQTMHGLQPHIHRFLTHDSAVSFLPNIKRTLNKNLNCAPRYSLTIRGCKETNFSNFK